MSIITIQGNRGSGKDQVAQYLQYLLSTPKFLHNYKIAKLLKFKVPLSKWKIVRYANKLKEILAILLNVPVERFEDREFKENYCFDFDSYQLYRVNEVSPENLISDKAFSAELKKGNLYIARQYYLTIRQILQFFGTEVMRNLFGDKLWIHTTLKGFQPPFIISDQRFIVENETSKHMSFCIHIIRPNCLPSFHSSESELESLNKDEKYDVLLKNDGTLKDLFNQCKYIIYEHKNKILP